MRKYTEVLRLRFELGLSQGQIARSCSISQSSVSNCLKRARAAGVSWPLPEGWDEARLEEALFEHALGRYETHPPRPKPDFARLHQELESHHHLTLELLWREYRQSYPDGYGYSQFCELYRMRQGRCIRATRGLPGVGRCLAGLAQGRNSASDVRGVK